MSVLLFATQNERDIKQINPWIEKESEGGVTLLIEFKLENPNMEYLKKAMNSVLEKFFADYNYKVSYRLYPGDLEENQQSYRNINADSDLDIQLSYKSADSFMLEIKKSTTLFDVDSLLIVVDEWLSYYDSICKGDKPNLPNTGIFEHGFIERNDEDQSGHWDEIIKNSVNGILTLDRKNIETIDARGWKNESFKWSYDDYTKLREFSVEHNISMEVILEAAWTFMLTRFSRQKKILYGTSSSMRSNFFETQGNRFLGYLNKSYPKVVTVPLEQTFTSWVKELESKYEKELLLFPSEDVIDEMNHLELDGFIEVKNLSEIMRNRNLERVNNFQVRKGEHFPLTLQCYIGKDIYFYLFYNSSIFNQSIISKLFNRFTEFLDKIVTYYDKRLCEIPYITNDELARLDLVNKNKYHDNTVSIDMPLHRMFEQQVLKRKQKVAITFENEQLTYDELNVKANKVANYLIENGISPGTLIGLSVERSLETVIGILGILKAGCAYVPLDPVNPKERLAYIIDDTKVPFVLTQEKLLSMFDHVNTNTICLDHTETFESQSVQNPTIEVGLDELAYIIYTSGSTGKPKGVKITHRNVTRLFESTDHWYRFDENDVWTLFHSYAFDFSVWEIWGALLYGGRLLVVPYLDSRSPDKFYNMLINEKVSVLNQTPSAFYQLIQVDKYKTGFERDQLNLRYIIFGGEALDFSRLSDWFSRHDDKSPQLINMYGITETTVHVSYYPVTKADSLSSQSSTIGKVIPDLQAFVLDENKQQVPIGVIGELYIGGPGLAQGYLHRPELTEERFIQNPFYKDSNEKLYRTGDLVRLNPDGNFEYIGRADQQVKIRGFRIELGEIEYQLMKYEGIQDAKVTVREDIPGDKRLVAYVISDKEVLYDEVKAFLSKHLPDYMVPAYIVEIESFPLTPNGKLDYRSLPQPDYNFKRSEFVKPRNATELTVAQVWSDVLNVEKIGVMDSFFELGGHSLLATQVVTRLSEEFQIELPIQVIFEKPKLEQLASHIDHVVAVGTDEGNEIKKVERTEPIPLSFAQQRMWFIDRLTSSSNLYNLSFAWDIKGDLSVDALEKSLNEVIRRHESLRTTIYEEDGRAYQNISPYKKQDIPVIDLSSLEDNEKRMKVDRMVKEEADKEFDLEKGPVLRVKLFKLSEKEFVLSCVMHHIVSDGWSMGVFLKEWFTLYREAVGEGKANLPPLPFQYADFAVWQKEWLNDEVLEQQLMYWKDELSGELPVLQLPLDYKRPAVQTYNGAVHKFKISKSLLNKLKQVGRMEDATLYMVLLAAYQGFLYKYTGQEDIVIGSPIANRTNSKIEGLIGFFVNTLPYRVQINSDMNFKELLAIVREKAIQGYSNQDVPFEKIVDEVAPGRDATYSSLFQTLFVLQNAPDFEIALEGLEFQELEIQRTTSKFDLSLIVEEKSGELEAEFEYNTDLFEEQRIERLSKQFINWLNNIADNSDKVLGDIQILTEEETKQMLVDWNDTAREYPREKTIHELFEEQVSLKPDGIALETEDGAVTYRELNESANQIAHYLIEQGIEIGDPIGICMNRSLEEIASMLGILKVGGAYVGLDPEYPEERLKHIVEETEMPLLLTTSQSGLDEAAYDVDIVNIDLLDLPEEKTNIFREGISATALSNIIYTSGSTGKPKGVCVPHRGVVRLVKGETYVPITSDDVFLHVASISFDATTLEVWSSLLNGARLVLLPTRNASLQDYENVIQKHNVSILWLTAGLFNVFVDHNLQALKGVKYLLIGGETVSVPHVRKAMEALEGTEIINGYGPSENTVFTTCHRIEEADLERPSIPIGRPIANTEVYVLDENQQPVPVGVIGELYAGGDGLAIGYMNRPELTAERFIPHPFKQESGEKLYRTGDLVRYLPDGKIEFIGRADHQVKIRGFRIELGEIEVVLKQYPDVRDAVTTVFEAKPGDKRLAAYIVGDDEINLISVRNFMKEKLPRYMVPAYISVLPSFPLTSNGKVNRKALPSPIVDRKNEDIVMPRNERERKLLEIWKSVLNQENIGVNDNFFELGGDSILSIQIVSRAKKEGINITPSQMFVHQTIIELAQVSEETKVAKHDERVVTGELPLTPIQSWFFSQNHPNPHHWNQSMILVTRKSLDEALLKQTFFALEKHHDALRLRYEYADSGQVIQYITEPDKEPPFTYYDISMEDSKQQEQIIKDVEYKAQRNIDIYNGPLWNAVYLKQSKTKGHLIWVVHHLAIDGVSWRILIEDFQNVYTQLENGEKVNLPAKTTSFKEWSNQLTNYSTASAIDQVKPYWLDLMEENVDRLPIDNPKGENLERTVEKVIVSLNASETKALLKDVPKAFRTQIDDVLLTALTLTISEWSGQDSLWINLEGHGREDIIDGVDLSRTVGWFTSLYPVHLKAHQGLESTLKQVKETLRGIPNKGIDYGILRYINEETSEILSNGFEPEISFNYLGQFKNDSISGLISDVLPFSEGSYDLGARRAHLLEVVGIIINDELSISFNYSNEQYFNSTIQKVANSFLNNLKELIEYCSASEVIGYTPSDFPLVNLSQQQLDNLMESKNKKIKTIYPLSPLQEGMTFHALLNNESGDYVTQWIATMEGELNENYFEEAWQKVLNQHDALRTGITQEKDGSLYQIVYSDVHLPITFIDWSELSISDQHDEFEQLLEKDRISGFDLDNPPLMRLMLIKLAENQYRFIWTSHHVILDGWSLNLILRDVFSYYESKVNGTTYQFEYTPQYQTYIDWLSKQDQIKAKEYWKNKLSGFTEPTPLGMECSEVQPETGYGEQISYIPKDLTTSIQSFARKNKLTPNTLFQAAWAMLLSCYSGEDDVVFGVTSSGRPTDLQYAEKTVGMFINTLPARIKLSQDTKVVDWLRELQQQQIEALQFEYSSLVDIQGWGDLLPGQPLFKSLFVYENYPIEKYSMSNIRVHDIRGIEQLGYPLGISITPDECFEIKVLFDKEKFNFDKINLIISQFMGILREFIEKRNSDLSLIQVLTKDEQDQVLKKWNETQQPMPSNKTIFELFEEKVEETPDAIAINCDNELVTYRELNERANQVANYLIAEGVGVEDRVGLSVKRSVEMIVGILGIMKAGGCYVPLDPNYPLERLDYMIKDADISLIITQEHIGIVEKFPEVKKLYIDRDADKLTQYSSSNIVGRVSEENLAYIIYTSGSTGRPKGVMIEHRNVVNVIKYEIEMFDIHPDSRVYQFTSLNFDVSVSEIMTTLVGGATLYLNKGDSLYGYELIDYIKKHHVTLVTLPISVLASLPYEDLDDLETIVVGGDTCPQHLVKLWGRGRKFINCYGPTEAAICSTMYFCDAESESAPPIGRPVANTSLYILDHYQRPVPIGVAGELYIGGAGVGRGYINQDDLTSESFIPDPFNPQHGKLMYKTGDLVRYLPDGNIEFVSRIDNQVKVRGFRIELGEIESVLLNHSEVKDCVVIVREDSLGEKQLVAYVITVNGNGNKQEIRDYLLEQLPEYMIPAYIIEMTEFPLTPNGKIDKKALPIPQHTVKEEVAPKTSIEELVTIIWSDVLGVDEIGSTDSFFEIGGHSLLATAAVSRLREAFGVDLSLRTLFEYTTVKELSMEIEKLLAGENHNKLPELKKVPRDEIIPLSYAQQRLWFFDKLTPQSALYNIPLGIKINGALQIEALERSVNRLIARHETLRTTIQEIDGKASQVIAPIQECVIEVEDFSSLTEEIKYERARSYAEMVANQPFNLQEGPLLRVHLMKLAEKEYIVLFTMHHIISDGWSMEIFVEELFAFYQEEIGEENADLSPLAIQYSDYAVWQREWLEDGLLEKQLMYWKEELTGKLPVLDLPTDYTRPPVQTYNGTVFAFEISESLKNKLEKLSKQQETTMFMTLLAAYQGFLARYTGQDDIIVGSPIANRNHPDIDGLIGFFVNTLPFRLKLTDEMIFNDILSEVRNKALNAYINQDIPFEKLVDEIQPERNLSYSPIYQTMFVYQKDLSLKDKCFGLDLTEWEVSQHLSNFDITLRINEQGKGLKATFEYNTDLFKEETIERLSRHFNHWLTNIVESPEKPVVYIPVIDGKEQQIILKDWNDNTIPLPNYEMINHWLEEQVLENPENAAIVSKFEKITYRELNQYSNRLAHYLLSRADSTAIDRIGICMNRSIDMIVAMLAVVKAGAAYVPIYPSYPADRIKYMVENSDISIIFSQSGLQQKTESLPSEIVFLDELKKDLSQYSTENIRLHDKNGENLTYVIYTSGSTGKPKGVMVTHRSLINLVNWHRTTYELSSQDRTSHIAGIAFDAAVWEIWPALCSGSALYLPEDEERLDPLKLQDWLVKNKISISFLPTPLAEKVIQLDWPKNVHLRALLTGGDKLHSFPSEDLPFSLYNHYGPTENTVVTTACLIEPKDSTQAPPIGYPIDNTEVYVLDQYMQPVPIGVVGELYIGGLSLAKGYLNQPELTNERFIRHPFNSSLGARLYKTGDLVRYLPNRCLEFVGRSDDQVQIRGYRIELGEIESTLINYEGVEDVVVITRELNHDVKQLVAYVMTKEELNIHEIREYLKEKLPSYMVPAYILTLDEFPLTPNGKVDREKLPEPKIEKDTGGYVAPRNDRERKLVEIWQQVLNQSNIGIYDNFFECGGDSILSIQVVSRASQAGIQITPKQIFEYQTVVELANVAKEMPKAHAEQCIVTGDVPLAPIQSWFFEQRYPNPHYWNQSMALSTARSLDIDLLRKSLHELSKHHDVLRLRYKSSESGEWKQYITADVVIDLEVYDVSELDGVEYHSFINKKESIAQSSLDIENGPIWKAVYFQNNSGKGRLFLVVHHLAIDGVSWRILIEDLETVYKQLESGQQISLPAKTTSYKEWVAELIRYSSSTEIDGAKEYWLDALQTESDSLPIKVNHTHSGISEKITVSLNATETKALLTKVTANYRAQIDEILLTALTKALTNSLEVENIWINLEGHGREEVVQNIDITRTIGWFTSMYPVLLSNEKDLAETLKYVKQILHRIPNKGVDYGILKYLNKDVAQKMKNQQVEPVISFNYLGQFNQSDSNALLLSYDTPTTSANVDPSAGQPHLLDIVGMVQDDELILQWSCDYELFDVFNIKNAASEMVIHLKAFITNDVSQTSAYAVTDFPDADLTDEELARLLNDDN